VKILVEVPESQGAQLQEVAKRLNVPAEELVSAAVRDLLIRGEGEFEAAAARVLEKNRELYKRLA